MSGSQARRAASRLYAAGSRASPPSVIARALGLDAAPLLTRGSSPSPGPAWHHRAAPFSASAHAAAERLNVLIITTDDMSCDSVGVYGAKPRDLTPNMDRLAGQSLRFALATAVLGSG